MKRMIKNSNGKPLKYLKMIPKALIRVTQNSIDRYFTDLKKEITNYERLQNNIQTNLDRLQNIQISNRMDMYSLQGLELVFTLKDANEKMLSVSQRALREIDSMTGVIAGYLTLLIEECIENYDISLKVWIKIKLNQLVELSEIKVQGVSNYLTFPAATATLIPLVIKTRICDSEISGKFVTIRNLIRELADPS